MYRGISRWKRAKNRKLELIRMTSSLIKRTSWTIVHRSHGLQELFELKHQTVMPELPNSLTVKIHDGGGRHIQFREMSLSKDWMKLSAPYLVTRCINAIWRWLRDQKAELEVNSRDVIKQTLETEIHISQLYCQLYTLLRYRAALLSMLLNFSYCSDRQATLSDCQQEAQLSQRDRASLLVTEYFAKSLKVTKGHSKRHCWVGRV